MILRLIGKKRIIILSVLLGINVLIAAALFLYVEPLREKAALRKQAVDNEIRDLRSSIDNIKMKIKSLEENQDDYDALKASGFFVDQNRFLAEKTLESMRRWSYLPGLSFSISPVEEIQDPRADSIKYKIVESQINIDNIRAYLDSDIYNFVQQVNKKFPGQTRVTALTINRGEKIDGETLSRIAQGETVGFVDASVAFTWRTMVPMEENTGDAAPEDPL